MRLLLIALALGLTATFVLAKKNKTTNFEDEEKNSYVGKKLKLKFEKKKSQKGTKKQMLGYPEPDDRQSMMNSLYGQGGLPAPGGGGGGLGNGGLGSEMEGMPTGIGGGGEPLGFRGEDEPPGPSVRIPGIMNGPSNMDEAAEIGRGGDENEYISRYSKGNEDDGMTEDALSRFNGDPQAQNYEDQIDKDQLGNSDDEDLAVTKAIGRPFQPGGNEGEPRMEQPQDSPFQQVKQENAFEPQMDSIASQASFAAQQMSPVRPGYEAGGALGPVQRESPSSELQQPEQEDQNNEQGVGEQESAGFRATAMSGGEALIGMNDQEAMKRHKLSNKTKKPGQNATKRKKIIKAKKTARNATIV